MTQLVVFDIAGTTVRDTGLVAKAFIDAFNEFDLNIPIITVNQVMGFRKKDAIRMLLPSENEVLAEQIHEAFISNMVHVYQNDPELQPLPHAEAVFKQLRQQGIKVALNTGFTRHITNTILHRLQWTTPGTIDMVVCSDEVPEGRPYPFMIKAIMQQLKVTDSKAVIKVGDTKVDVEEGRNAGCGLVVSVTTGASPRSELELYKPDRIIDTLAGLLTLLSVVEG